MVFATYVRMFHQLFHVLSVHGEIRTTSCQARLVMSERFKQFSGLVANCENKTGEKPVLEEDLEGFWDMVYNQVRRFHSFMIFYRKNRFRNEMAKRRCQKIKCSAVLVCGFDLILL